MSVAEPPWLSDPLAAVTLTVELPMAVPVVVLTVSVVDPEPVTELGLKLPVAPDGSPDTPKFTVPLKPLIGVTVTVYEVLLPTTTVCEDGDIVTE